MNALTVQSLTKVYGNGILALKGINLTVKEGDFFALLGKNGAGKSTTIGIISSLVTKTNGKVFIFDVDLDRDQMLAKSLIGIVPQEMNFNLFEKTSQILVNQAGYYGIPRKLAIKNMNLYLKEMGLWDMRDQVAMRLSGGMKRRLMIARAMMNNPKLLILDEPTAGVDIEIRHHLWQFLRQLNERGTTIILTTHYLEEAEHLCKHVAIIDDGQIIENANIKSLMNRLHMQIIILDLQKPLATPPSLLEFNCDLIDELTLEVKVGQGQSLNQLFFLLNEQDITIQSMRNKTNRLEALFMNLIQDNKKGGSNEI